MTNVWSINLYCAPMKSSSHMIVVNRECFSPCSAIMIVSFSSMRFHSDVLAENTLFSQLNIPCGANYVLSYFGKLITKFSVNER